jgi:hypothetical protein
VRASWPHARTSARRLSGEEIRINGPGFVDEATGEVLLSPWRVVSIRGGVVRLACAFPATTAGAVDVAQLVPWQVSLLSAAENVAELLQPVGEGEALSLSAKPVL